MQALPLESVVQAKAEEAREALTPLHRVDVEGIVFAMAVDPDGRLITTTQRGEQAAVSTIGPGDGADETVAPSLKLRAHVIPRALTPTVFALLSSVEGTLELLKATAQTLEVTDTLTLGGRPLQMAVAQGLIWIVDGEAKEGIGLIAVDPTTGEVRERVETGPRPVELTVAEDKTPPRLYLTTHGEGGGQSAVLLIDLEHRRRVRRAFIEGFAASIVAPPSLSVVYALRYNSPNLLVLDAQTGAVLGRIELGFQPTRVLPWSRGEASGLLVLSAQGPLVRLSLSADGRSARVEARRTLGPGSTELLHWPQSDAVFLLDRAAGALRWLALEDLSDRATLEMGARTGRLIADIPRDTLYVSLPELKQIAIIRAPLAARGALEEGKGGEE